MSYVRIRKNPYETTLLNRFLLLHIVIVTRPIQQSTKDPGHWFMQCVARTVCLFAAQLTIAPDYTAR